MIKVSIIVPVYNVEDYLKKCLVSLANQTLDNIEIIAINDGSTDNSLEILYEFEKKYNNIIIINKENGGQSSARNLGLKHAKGEYIGFVDSDDFIDENMFFELYKIAKIYGLDIAHCNYINWYGESSSKNYPYDFLNKETEVMSGKKYFQLDPSVSVCDKIFKRSFLEKINFKFENGIYAEDALLLPQVFYYARRVKYINKYLYYYRRRNASTCNPVKIDQSIKLALDKFYVANKLNSFKNKKDWSGNISRIIIPNIITPFLKKEILNNDYRRELFDHFFKEKLGYIFLENIDIKLLLKFIKMFFVRLIKEGKI